MVGISTVSERALNGEGLILHFGYKNADDMPSKTSDGIIVSAFVSRDDCNHIYDSIREARRKYWKKVEKK